MDISKISSIVQTMPFHKTSSKYSFIPTTKPLQVLEDMGWYISGASQSNSKYDGYQKHLIRLQNTKYSNLTTEGIPELLMVNNHMAKGKFEMMLGFYRTACANGLIVGDTLMKDGVRHIGYTDEKVSMVVSKLSSNVDSVVNSIQKMQERFVTPTKQYEFVSDVINETLQVEVKDPACLLISRRKEDGNINSRNLWQTFNIVQENIMKGSYQTVNLQNKIRKAKIVQSIDRNVNINTGMWNVASNYIN